MSRMFKRTILTLGVSLMTAGSAHATAVALSLGPSAENLTLYGTGESSPGSGLGTFKLGQGSSVYNPVGNLSTFTLSGVITSSNLAGFTSGTYEIVTTYLGLNTPQAGPGAPSGRSNPSNVNFFNYTGFDPSTDMVLLLHSGGNTFSQSLVENGVFSGAGFSFGYVSTTCTGVAVCSQNDVGLTPGATIAGSVRTTAQFNIDDPVPGVPEPATWISMIGGLGLVGGAMRRRRAARATISFA